MPPENASSFKSLNSLAIPAPSCPRITGNSPSGSSPERVNASVWQTPVAFISIKTSPALRPSRSTSKISGARRRRMLQRLLISFSILFA